MDSMNEYERERAANIAANKALLAQLKLENAATAFFPKPPAPAKKSHAKPVQPAKKKARLSTPPVRSIPTRSSTRLKRSAPEDPNESPRAKKLRLAEEAERERLREEEAARELQRIQEAKQPRHQDLNLSVLGENEDNKESLQSMFKIVTENAHARRSHIRDADMDEDVKTDAGMEELKKRFAKLVVKSRAKVTEDRIYSAAYHPERTKDLVFFGDKHGQLGIWDAQAPQDAPEDDEDTKDIGEGGTYWRLQAHWPATSRSSISCIKFDPLNAQSVYTASYDCTIRRLTFETGVSKEIFSLDGTLISSFDIVPTGHELWVSDVAGGVTHLDVREPLHKARRWAINLTQKIGCVSVNPANPNLLVTASNDRTLKLWDTRNLPWGNSLPSGVAPPTPPPTSPAGSPARDTSDEPTVIEHEDLLPLYTAKVGKKGYGLLKAQYEHGMSVSSAYWDPAGTKVVSTSYDDHVRVWDLKSDSLARETPLQMFKPRHQISHDCQTGRWLTILRAQWSPNPDVHPHFTIGNMKHSLDIFSHTGEQIARLYDNQKITAVQAVTCSHPSNVDRAASGNGSGRCILWAPAD